jgi:hypothetical protein
MIAVKEDGKLERNKRGKVKTYGCKEDVHTHFRCWDDAKLLSRGVEIVDLTKKEIRDANR